MAASTYIAFTDRMISRYEGGYGWNRRDPGGPTKYGITCYDLAEHRGQRMDSMDRWAPIVAAMPKTEAEAIYKTKYATAIRYDELPAGVDACVEDYAVNSGYARAVRVARAIVGVKASGSRMDDATLDAIRKMDPKQFIAKMCAERLAFMHAIRGGEAWAEFGHGWQARVNDLKVYCDHLAANDNSPAPEAPDLTKIVQPKAVHVPKTAGKKTAGTAIAAGAASAGAGAPHWQTGLIIFGVFVIGIAYEAYHDIKANAANNAVHLPAAA